MWVYFLIIIIAIILIYGFITYNQLVKLNNMVQEAFSTMDVYLKKRWDLIPNLVETVREYAKYEKNILEEIVELRNNSYDQMDKDQKLDTNHRLTKQLNQLLVLAEAYPDLKANDNFRNLSNQLTKIEDDIANSRKYYNGTVRMMNNKVQMFPSNIFAMMTGFKTQKMFEAKENERENVKVEL